MENGRRLRYLLNKIVEFNQLISIDNPKLTYNNFTRFLENFKTSRIITEESKTTAKRGYSCPKRFKINYQSSTIDKNTITTKPKEKTVNSNNVEIEQYLSDLAYNKMEELDLFKSTAADIERQQIIRKYKLSSYHINAISKLQIIIRSWIIRKKFIKAIRMNKYIEHKHNYKKLKRSIVKFDKKHKKSKAYKRYVNNLQKPYD